MLVNCRVHYAASWRAIPETVYREKSTKMKCREMHVHSRHPHLLMSYILSFVMLFSLFVLGCEAPEPVEDDVEQSTEVAEETEAEPELPPPPPLTRALLDEIPYGLGYWEVYDLLGEQEEDHRETVLVDDLPHGARPYAIVWRTWRLEDEPDMAYRLGFISDSLEEKEEVEWEDRFETPVPADRLREQSNEQQQEYEPTPNPFL